MSYALELVLKASQPPSLFSQFNNQSILVLGLCACVASTSFRDYTALGSSEVGGVYVFVAAAILFRLVRGRDIADCVDPTPS